MSIEKRQKPEPDSERVVDLATYRATGERVDVRSLNGTSSRAATVRGLAELRRQQSEYQRLQQTDPRAKAEAWIVDHARKLRDIFRSPADDPDSDIITPPQPPPTGDIRIIEPEAPSQAASELGPDQPA